MWAVWKQIPSTSKDKKDMDQYGMKLHINLVLIIQSSRHVAQCPEEVLGFHVIKNRNVTLKVTEYQLSWDMLPLTPLPNCLFQKYLFQKFKSQENWVWVQKVSRPGHVVVCKEKGAFLPSIHLGLDAQACMGMFCHLGKACGPTGEVDSSCFLASCLHTVMSGRCSSDRDRVSLSQICAGTRCPGGPSFPPSPMLARASQPTHSRKKAYKWLRSWDSESVRLGLKIYSDLILY